MADSLTKNKQSEKNLEKIVEKYFSPIKLNTYKELTEGYFNVAYEITLSNQKAIILKIAPSKETRIMTYETNIMFSEVNSMEMAYKKGGIPVPKILGYDNSCTICNSPYFFMEKLEGNSLFSIKSTIDKDTLSNIYTEIGRINKRINEIICPCFGYPGEPEFQGAEWYPVFKKMLQAGINDAQRGNVDIKIPINTLFEYLERDKEIFSEITEPRLVHWDLWDGNIFVKDGKITGIIDWERCIWGDPLLEVSFRCYDLNPNFLKGYGISSLTENQKRRSLWYDIYLFILQSLECEYRKYETMEFYDRSIKFLKEQFTKLSDK